MWAKRDRAGTTGGKTTSIEDTMELVLATGNPDKIREIKKVLGGLDVTMLTFEDFSSFPTPEETAVTLRENALFKGRVVAGATEKLSLADDSGLEVRALNGAPGVRSARFAGEGVSYEDNNKKLLSLLKGLPESKRGAVFRCVMALVHPKGKGIVAEGLCPGTITTSPRGTHGFGYDPLFQPKGFTRTFAEMSLAEKNRISHRAKALDRIKEILAEVTQAEGKFLVGLTGNMGCGKSTVAQFFEKWGLKVIRADEVGHWVLTRGDVKEKVMALFGDDIIGSDGEISRAQLRHKVVADKEKLSSLNRLLHPAIKKRVWERITNDNGQIVLIEAALMFESGWDFFMNRVITVHCSQDTQMQRISRKTTLDLEEVNGLLKAQLSQEEKIKRADFAIPNDDDLRELEARARAIFDTIVREAERSCEGR